PWGLVRQNGFRFFEGKGLPSKLLEDWKYTSLKSLTEDQLQPQDFSSIKVPAELKERLQKELNPQFFNLLFFNGVLVENLSDLGTLGKIKVYGLQEIDQTSVFSSIRKARQQVGEIRQDSMEALNSAFVL